MPLLDLLLFYELLRKNHCQLNSNIPSIISNILILEKLKYEKMYILELIKYSIEKEIFNC